jgi:hypothetical protein
MKHSNTSKSVRAASNHAAAQLLNNLYCSQSQSSSETAIARRRQLTRCELVSNPSVAAMGEWSTNTAVRLLSRYARQREATDDEVP